MSEKLSAFIGAAGQLAAHLEKTRPAASTADTASVTEGAGDTANVEGTPAPKSPLTKEQNRAIKVPKTINLGAAGSLLHEDFSDVELDDAPKGEVQKKEAYRSPAELATERLVNKDNPFGVRVPKASKKTKRARGGSSFSNDAGLLDASSEELSAKVSNDTLRHAAQHLAGGSCENGNCSHTVVNRGPAGLAWAFPATEKATPKGRRNSSGKLIPEGVGEGAAHDAWNSAKDLHTVLLRHSETMGAQLGAKADELDSRIASARNIASQSDGLTDKDQQSLDSSIANVSSKAAWLRGQATTHALREDRTGHDSLVQIGAALDSMKTPDGKFKDASPIKLHSAIQDALSGLSRVHNLYQNNAVAPYGVGSPVSDEDVKHAVRVARKLTTKAAPTPVEGLPRDMHPDYKDTDNDGNIKNPQLALAKPGHVWGIGLTPDLNGNHRQVEATPANLEQVEKILGRKHQTTNKLRALVKAQDPQNPTPITSGSWFNSDGTPFGKKSKTEIAKESLTDPEELAKAETQRMRSITTKTSASTGYNVTKPVANVDYVPAVADDETDIVGDRDAEPGHMFTTDGKKTIKISKGNLESLVRLKGADHPDAVKMDKLYREAKGLPTKEEEADSQEKRAAGYERSLGELDKELIPTGIGSTKNVGKRQASPGSSFEGTFTPEPESRSAVFERTVPGAQDSLVEEAVGHITAGRRVPRDLRRTIGAAGIAKAIQKAGVTQEPNGRS